MSGRFSGNPAQQRRHGRRVLCALFLCAFALVGPLFAADPFALFADSLVAAVNRRDSAFVDACTDPALFTEALRTAQGLPISARQSVEAVVAGMRRLGSVVLREAGPGTAFSAVRIEQGGNGERVLLCRTHGERMLSYVRVSLVRRGERVMIADWHNLATGVSVRESLRFWVEAVRGETGTRGSVPVLFARLQAGDAAGAREELRRLPSAIAEHPVVVAARVAAARSAGTEDMPGMCDWLAARRRRARRYALLLVDCHMARGEYRRALWAADRVERLVGPDAGVDCLRAAILGVSGRTAAAYGAFAEAIEREPSFEAIYWRLLDLLVTDRKYADATLVLDVLAVKFGYNFDVDEFSEVESYREFVRSNEFRRWASEWEQ